MLKRFLEKFLCKHQWVVHSKTNWIDPDTDDTWITEILICSKCGKIKKIKL